MRPPGEDPRSTAGGRSTFVFDGACPFCSACARLIVRHVPTRARVVAYQLIDLDAIGLTVDEAQESVQWVAPGGHRASGPAAIAALLRDSRGRGWRGAGWVLARRPVLAVARPVYAWVSRHRNKLPLTRPVTDLPPSDRDIFADPRWRGG